jgi:hypothetical protein
MTGLLEVWRDKILKQPTLSEATIDNNQYTYRIDVYSMDGSTNHRLYGVVLEYEVTDSLP